MHEEACRFHIQLLAYVFANLDQGGAALAAFARRRFVTVLDTRQLWGQWLATGALARLLGRCLAVEFFVDGCQVHIDRLVKQRALFTDQRFAGFAEANSFVISQLERQRLDLEVILGQLGLLLRKRGPYLRQHGGIDIGTGKVVEQIHAVQVTGLGQGLQAQQFTSS